VLICYLFECRKDEKCTTLNTEAEFLDVIGTKVLIVFLLAIHSHLGFYPCPPPPLSKSGLKLVSNAKHFWKPSFFSFALGQQLVSVFKIDVR
jgi:hypothetical protein